MGTSAKAGVAALVIGIVASAAIGLRIEDWTDLIGVYFFGALLLMAAGAVTFSVLDRQIAWRAENPTKPKTCRLMMPSGNRWT
jgi:hypothetical protein